MRIAMDAQINSYICRNSLLTAGFFGKTVQCGCKTNQKWFLVHSSIEHGLVREVRVEFQRLKELYREAS